MGHVELTIDDKKVQAKEGDTVLWAALDAGIYIPHLCADREMDYHPASCRLCWVEIEGKNAAVTSCTEKVKPGMVVHTRTEKVDALVRQAFDLLMSVHHLDCGNCPANRRCALQEIAKKRKIPLKPKTIDWPRKKDGKKEQPPAKTQTGKALLKKIETEYPIDESREDFGLNPNRCVLCGKCVHVCNEVVGCKILDLTNRGMKTVVATFDGRPLAESPCDGCLKCVAACPAGALYMISDKPPEKAG